MLLNALASYTAPEYDNSTIGLKAPWMRITIGDLFYQQPAIIQNLFYTLVDSDTTWEINIEKDPDMMEAPQKIEISMGLAIIPDYVPQKGGRMYTLAKEGNGTTNGFDENGLPLTSKYGNWLADSYNNGDVETLPAEESGKGSGNTLKNRESGKS